MNITIPPAALEAGARAAHNQWRHDCAAAEKEPVENWREWPDIELAEQLGWVEQARAAFEAMVENWPGMIQMHHPRDNQHTLILPLTENPDAEA